MILRYFLSHWLAKWQHINTAPSYGSKFWFSCDLVIVQNQKLVFSSEVLVLSEKSVIKPFRNLTFYNVLARQGASFINKTRLNFQALALGVISLRPEKALA